MLTKYRVSLKIGKCKLFQDRFEYVGRDILWTGNTTAQSKYELVRDWKLHVMNYALLFHSVISMHDSYPCFKSNASHYGSYMHIAEKGGYQLQYGQEYWNRYFYR